MSTKNNAAAQKGQQATYEQIQRSLKDQATVEEKQIQQSVKSNLKSLKNSIEKTKEDLDTAVSTRNNLLESSSVNWSSLVTYDGQIEGYTQGLKMLKEYRDTYFPDWKTTLIED